MEGKPVTQAKAALAVWATRAVISISCYLLVEMRNDVKLLTQQFPVMQEQIRTLKEENQKLQQKVFSQLSTPAKKEDEINFQNIIKGIQ